MRLGIVTQPLSQNYGGILQNYALQQMLKRMGHEPITIDWQSKTPLWTYLLRTVKNTLFFCIPGIKSKFAPWPKIKPKNKLIAPFIDTHIHLTDEVTRYNRKLVDRYQLDGLIAGSDQVWRPKYNHHRLYDCYLQFAKGKKIFRMAYAASFGVDYWEYSKRKTARCKKLIRMFDAVSVREHSGIELCASHLDCKAIEVLDPTLLLSAEDYTTLCIDIPKPQEAFLAAYLLDADEEKRRMVEEIASRHRLSVHYVSADNDISLRVEEWLALFRDANLVVTDSFHGTVFSIINHTDFISIPNPNRGASRFESLLSKFDLSNRLIRNPEKMTDLPPIDWKHVDELKRQWQKHSVDFLAILSDTATYKRRRISQ